MKRKQCSHKCSIDVEWMQAMEHHQNEFNYNSKWIRFAISLSLSLFIFVNKFLFFELWNLVRQRMKCLYFPRLLIYKIFCCISFSSPLTTLSSLALALTLSVYLFFCLYMFAFSALNAHLKPFLAPKTNCSLHLSYIWDSSVLTLRLCV